MGKAGAGIGCHVKSHKVHKIDFIAIKCIEKYFI
jgi:hypothetical protein